MKRFMFALLLASLVLGAVGCGSSDGGGSTDLQQRIVGQWIRDQESSDGGSTWKDRSDDLRILYRADGTWADNRNRTGTYSIYSDRIVMRWPAKPETRYARVKVISGGQRLEFIYYSGSSYNQTTGYRARWTRISGQS